MQISLSKVLRIASALFLGTCIQVSFSAEVDHQDVAPIHPQQHHFHMKGYTPATKAVRKHLNTQLEKKQEHLALHFPHANALTEKVVKKSTSTGILELPLIAVWPGTPDYFYDQGNLGSCTANSLGFCIQYGAIANSKTPNVVKGNPAYIHPSRNFQYYNMREIECYLNGVEFDPTQDTGGSIIGSIIAGDMYGAYHESGNLTGVTISGNQDLSGKEVLKPIVYDVSKFAEQPKGFQYVMAQNSKLDALNAGTQYASGKMNPYAFVAQTIQYTDLASDLRKKGTSQTVQDTFYKRVCAALKRNHPVAIGLALDDSFQDAVYKTGGFVPTPNPSTFEATGGHAMAIVGVGKYKPGSNEEFYLLRNSWGTADSYGNKIGHNGYFYISRRYMDLIGVYGVEAFEVFFNPSLLH